MLADDQECAETGSAVCLCPEPLWLHRAKIARYLKNSYGLTHVQGLSVPIIFGILLPEWMGFAAAAPADSSTYTTKIQLQDMQIAFNFCGPGWTELATLLSTPRGVRQRL